MSWTPVAKQAKTWTEIEQRETRTFSPYTFSRRPVFDTGFTSGVWDAQTKQAENWAPE